MTISGLLLTTDRLAQFNTALGASGLATLMAEAEVEVLAKTAGRTIDQPMLDTWVRTITLYHAYLAAEFGVPKDLLERFTACQRELLAIADGSHAPPSTAMDGAWGSKARLKSRDE